MKLPHQDTPQGEDWQHIRFANWTGSYASPTIPIPEASQVPGVHLTRPGSNLCLTGFRDPAQARAYRAEFGNPDWRVSDLRDSRPQLTAPDLFFARQLAAQRIFEDWDFGDLAVEAQNGWEHDGQGRFERRAFFDTGAEETAAATFAVEFEPGSHKEYRVEFEPPSAPEAGLEAPEYA